MEFNKFFLKEMYSFENFPDDPTNLIKLTPRSNEALLRSGFRLEDLIKKTPEEINKKYGNLSASPQLVEKRIQHEEEKRMQRISNLTSLRNQVVEE